MTFQQFTGREYLKLDIAGSFGLEKEDWNVRLDWFDKNETQLHSLVPKAEEPALFYAGILAWEKSKAGKPCGYPISLDATSSGIQILAALAGDRKAAQISNVVDSGHRQDAYTVIYQDMVTTMGQASKIDRKLTKKAIMTAFYGSTAQPKRIFGDGDLLQVFKDTVAANAPGAWEINEVMLAIWDDTALENSWILPDNFHVHVKVMGEITESVHFLNEPFEVTRRENMPTKGGRSLGANVVHSIDGMVVREMQRRCNYNHIKIQQLVMWITNQNLGKLKSRPEDELVMILWDNYKSTGFLSARILDYLDNLNLGLVDWKVISRMIATLPTKPFEVISIHDCFRCLPNYGNDLRLQYNEILASIAESEMLSSITSQICKRPIQAGKLDANMGRDIRQANYALS